MTIKAQTDSEQSVCDRPPPGWSCSRARGHDGPCAASPVEERRVSREVFVTRAQLDYIAETVRRLDREWVLIQQDHSVSLRGLGEAWFVPGGHPEAYRLDQAGSVVEVEATG